MALLIDGYNLLHVTGISGEASGPGNFQLTREALLNFLAATIEPSERIQTTIVFDAADAPPGLPHTITHQEMTVRYAADYPDADTLIEELISHHNTPRKLLVVSSDHRIQRAARRRRARFVDSEQWYAECWQRRVQARGGRGESVSEKPRGKLNAAEVAYWVDEFAAESTPRENSPTEEQAKSPPKESQPNANPFPPGYGEDLLEEE